MLIRSYRRSDLDTLHQIDQACFPPGVSYSRVELANFIDHRRSQAWIAEEEGAIVGFLVADGQPQRVGHIITIDVVAEWRRRGVGTLLMDAAEDWAQARRLRLIYLETSERNAPAQRFYTQRGYEKLKLIERYYGNGDAAWVMVKWLEERQVASREEAEG
jgi:ribosomal-protein-alanine N-acetyltransferase